MNKILMIFFVLAGFKGLVRRETNEEGKEEWSQRVMASVSSRWQSRSLGSIWESQYILYAAVLFHLEIYCVKSGSSFLSCFKEEEEAEMLSLNLEIIEYFWNIPQGNWPHHKSGGLFFFPLFLLPPTAGLLSREFKVWHWGGQTGNPCIRSLTLDIRTLQLVG